MPRSETKIARSRAKFSLSFLICDFTFLSQSYFPGTPRLPPVGHRDRRVILRRVVGTRDVYHARSRASPRGTCVPRNTMMINRRAPCLQFANGAWRDPAQCSAVV